MSNEARVRGSLTIRKNNIDYTSKPTSFLADVAVAIGPTPGAIAVSTAGVDVDLSQLTTPGLAVLHNLGTSGYVEVGVWDGVSYYPLLELLPGEVYPVRLSRNLGQEYGTGTGTTGLAVNTLRLKANGAACVVVVEAFNK